MWLNEGHFLYHHRDGVALQGWRFHRMEKNNLKLGAGFGVYRFCDTMTEPGQGADYQNRHGLKPILSLRAQYPMPGGDWNTFVQVNRTFGPGAQQTQAMLAGVSTRFGGPEDVARPSVSLGARGSDTTRNELTLLFGSTIMNSFESQTTNLLEAFALQYRRRLTRNLDASLEYDDEGTLDTFNRAGVVAQAWATVRTPENGWLLSFGVGPYFNRVFSTGKTTTVPIIGDLHASMRYSMLLGRQIWGHWGGRLQWNRTITRNDKDTDMLLAGIAYQW